MKPWEKLGIAHAPDGVKLELRKRDDEFRIWAGKYELMSSQDEPSSRALADLGLKQLPKQGPTRVLVGGLGMGFTLRAALDRVGPSGIVEVAELVSDVVEWNRGPLGELAKRPLDDPRTEIHVIDVALRIRAAGPARYDAILLDVDNGPIHVAHEANDGLYGNRGIAEQWAALKPGGALGLWSLADHAGYTSRLSRRGFQVRLERTLGSRIGRGKEHVVWVARKPAEAADRRR